MIEVLSITRYRETREGFYSTTYLYHFNLSKYRISWKSDGRLYWEHVVTLEKWQGSNIRSVMRKLKKKAKIYNLVFIKNIMHHKKVTPTEASILSGILKPMCMDWLMEQEHPFFGDGNLTNVESGDTLQSDSPPQEHPL